MILKVPKNIQAILKEAFLKAISTLFNITCIGLVCWKIIQGIMKYVDKPQGTKISIDPSSNHKFPTMIFCFEEDDQIFNDVHLKNCKING